jgi:hypothetical protein
MPLFAKPSIPPASSFLRCIYLLNPSCCHSCFSLSSLSSLRSSPRRSKRLRVSLTNSRGVESPISYLYLQSLPTAKDIPVMGPEASSEYFTIRSSIQSLNSSLYLNIGPSSEKSYLPLSFDETSNTTAWGSECDTVIIVTGSTHGRRK